MLPYEIDREIVLVNGAPHELPSPTRGNLLALIITGLTDGDKVNLYSRLLVDEVDVLSIRGNSTGKCVIHLDTELMARVGDNITIADNSEDDYNTTHKITDRRQSDGLALTTDIDFVDADATVVAVGGTASTNFTAALYRVIPEQTVANSVVNWSGDLPFINNDPKHLYDGALRPRLWLVANASATVRVVARYRLPETMT